jgi:hypothetical protein
VRHLPGDEHETTAISELEIVVSAAKQRSMTTEVLGGM